MPRTEKKTAQKSRHALGERRRGQGARRVSGIRLDQVPGNALEGDDAAGGEDSDAGVELESEGEVGGGPVVDEAADGDEDGTDEEQRDAVLGLAGRVVGIGAAGALEVVVDLKEGLVRARAGEIKEGRKEYTLR